MGNPHEVKERIIEATIALINESEGDVTRINTRTITEQAGVGLGMINYHFQTKERLFEICVERIIENQISTFRPETPHSPQTPRENARNTAKQVADFLFSNQAVSRISILSDFKTPQEFDNTMKSVRGLENALAGLAVDEQERHLMAFTLISTMQTLFLRPELFGIDMRNKSQRDEVLDLLVDCLFRDRTEKE